MKQYAVRQGDFMTRIASGFGVSAEDIWNHPKNDKLRKERTDMNVLCPGDVLFIPDKPPKKLKFSAQSTNEYVATVPKVNISIALTGSDGPLANEPYVILGLGEPVKGTTDGQGMVKFEASAFQREVKIILEKKKVAYPVLLGTLDPIKEKTGMRARLRNLGYYGLQDDSSLMEDAAERDRQAILAFQHAEGLEETGKFDDTTRDALQKAHGS
jgi:hypothetical protein